VLFLDDGGIIDGCGREGEREVKEANWRIGSEKRATKADTD
jgi:hypothetical protein